METEKAYLGTGMQFPPQVDLSTGRFAVAKAEQSVKESIYLILMTQQGERVFAPQFGSDTASLTFMDTSITMLRLMESKLKAQLTKQEPRITDVDVHMDPDQREGCLMITISYAVQGSYTKDSLVFPFYLMAVQEEEEVDEAAESL